MFGQSMVGFSISLGRIPVCQAAIYIFLNSIYEVQKIIRSEKYISICSDSQAAFEALQAVTTYLPATRVIFPPTTVRLVYVPENSGAGGNETAYVFTRNSSAEQFAGPELTLQISWQNVTHNIMGWLFNQHMTLQQMYQHSERQSQQLISGTSLADKARYLS